MASLSVQLKRERELRGISLRQIAEDTKISVRFLEAIEQDRMDVIPGEFYRRSYLRSYARYLGLDENRAINDYNLVVSKAQSSNAATLAELGGTARTTQKVDESTGESSPTGRNAGNGWRVGGDVPVWVIAAAVGIGVVWILWLGSGMGSAPVSEGVAASTAETTPAEVREPSANSRRVSATPDEPDAPLAEARVSMSMDTFAARLVVREPCWLEIRVDGQLVAEGLKPTGFFHEVSVTDEIRLWLGNAGGVSLWLNGDEARALGRDGQVVKDIRITRDNVGEFVDGGSRSNDTL